MDIDIERLKVDPVYWDEVAAKNCKFALVRSGRVIAWAPDGHQGTWAGEIIRRPTTPEPKEWDGEGLPPVGCEVEMSLGFHCGIQAKITYMGDGVFCYRNLRNGGEYTGAVSDSTFRPLRTQAEREREELADLCRAKFNQHTSSSNSYLWQQVADAIIAAGWRKGE